MADTGFSRVPNAVLKDESLSPNAKLLYCVGMSYLNGAGPQIFPSYKKLAERCGFSRDTAIRAAKELVAAGHWQMEFRRDDETMRVETNLIRYLNIPPGAASLPATPSCTQQLPSRQEQLPSVTQQLGVVAESNPKKTKLEQDPLKKEHGGDSRDPTAEPSPPPASTADFTEQARQAIRDHWPAIRSCLRSTTKNGKPHYDLGDLPQHLADCLEAGEGIDADLVRAAIADAREHSGTIHVSIAALKVGFDCALADRTEAEAVRSQRLAWERRQEERRQLEEQFPHLRPPRNPRQEAINAAMAAEMAERAAAARSVARA